MITVFLCIALFYLALTSVVFAMNLRDFNPLSTLTPEHDRRKNPLVSICIPARNEEAVIARALQSVLTQKYERTEILVLDDQSTDQTSAILSDFEKNHSQKLTILQGKPKPDDWLGKSWACHQLSIKAKGDVLFFIDADVWLQPQAVGRVVKSLQQYNLDFLTVWPMQQCQTFWQKAVIPLIYCGLLSLLPARYVYEKPRWLPLQLKDQMAPQFAAACGQCMVFRQKAYQKINGHRSVKNDIVEDVALAKEIKKKGLIMRMFHGQNTVSCRMYRSDKAMWHGFRKNFLALFNDSIALFVAMSLLNLIVFILPLLTFVYGLFIANLWYIWLSAITVIWELIIRFKLARWYSFDTWMSFSLPLGVLWFELLGARVLADRLKGNPVTWKARPTK